MDKTYSQIYLVNLEKKKIYPKDINSANNYLKNIDINFIKPTRDSDKEIYRLSSIDEFNHDPILCLRCRVSKSIYNQCKDVYDNNSEKIDLIDLSRFALLDDGKKY